MIRRLLPRIALLLATCLLLFGAAEVVTRLAFPPASFGDDPALAGKYHPNRTLHYLSHQDGYDVTVRFNSLGMRDREHPLEKPAGARRVLVLGDSFMEAKQVAYEESFPAVLGRALSASGEVEVLNTGHAGFGAAEEYLVMKQFGVPRRPDLVVQAFFMNDVGDDLAVLGELVWSATGLPVKMVEEGPHSLFWTYVGDQWRRMPFMRDTKVVRRDELGDLARDPFAILRGDIDRRNEADWARTLGSVEATAALARRIGAGYLLVVIPLAQQVDPQLAGAVAEAWYLEADKINLLPQKHLAEFGLEKGVAVMDLLPVLATHKDERLYFEHDGHWTARAHQLAAEAVAARVLADEWKPRPAEQTAP